MQQSPMRCPFCDSKIITVKGTRDTDDEEKIVRQRECERGHRFRTTEAVGELLVRKGAGGRYLEPFDKAKIARSVKTALYKWMSERDAWAEGWEAATRVRAELLSRLDEKESIEVYPSEIGQLVLEELKGINWFGWLSYQGVFRKEKTDVKDKDGKHKEEVQQKIEALLDEILTVPKASSNDDPGD